MKIILVNPSNSPKTNRSIIAEPIDLLTLATIVRKKHKNTILIDMDMEELNNNINDYLEEDNIIIFTMDYIIPLHSGKAINNIFETIKNLNKKSRVIMIGKNATFNPENFFQNGIDIIINRNPELIINDVIDHIDDQIFLKSLINNLYLRQFYKREDNFILTNDINKMNKTINLDELPITDRTFLDLSKYNNVRTMVTSRGCLNHCKFCVTPNYFGNFIYRSENSILKEIKYLVKNYNTKKIMFLDDNFIVNKTRVINLCNLIIKNKIKCLFGCLASINCYDYELFKLMYQAGFRFVHFGIETGSKELLKKMHKPNNLDIAKIAIKEVKELGFRVRNSYILDYPTSTKDDIDATYEFIKETLPHEIRLHYLAYRSGSDLKKEYPDKVTSDYIHSNHQNIKNELNEKINELINKLESDYLVVKEDIDWNKYEFDKKNFKVVALTPVKYGMCWYE